MPSSKGKGNGKGSPQKKAAARRVQTRSTKSIKQVQIEEIQLDTLATISSPKAKLNPKKLTPPSKSTTSPLPIVGEEETPERRKSFVQAVTETKQDNFKEEETKSTGSDSDLSSVNQVGTTINLSNMADPRLDKQLDHVLE